VVDEGFFHHGAFGFAREFHGDGSSGDIDDGADAFFEVYVAGFAGDDQGVCGDAFDDAPSEDVLDFTGIGAVEKKHGRLSSGAGGAEDRSKWA
jgi:hypothetical protein